MTQASDKRTKVSDSELRKFVGYHLKRASNVIQADLAETLREFDLRVLTFSALVLVEENEGLSQTQLAEVMGMERPNLVAIVDTLENLGLVVRDRDAADRRAYELRMTAKGTSVCTRAKAAVRQHEAALLSTIDEKDREALIALLAQIRSITT